MKTFILRLRNGNCVIVIAHNENEALDRARNVCASSEVASIRLSESFAAQFSLTDDGELRSVLLDETTLTDLLAHEYPMLNAALSQSYQDFEASETDSRTEYVLFNEAAREHKTGWDGRNKNLISYAVQQERERLAN
jgi:hypothetical protein